MFARLALDGKPTTWTNLDFNRSLRRFGHGSLLSEKIPLGRLNQPYRNLRDRPQNLYGEAQAKVTLLRALPQMCRPPAVRRRPVPCNYRHRNLGFACTDSSAAAL